MTADTPEVREARRQPVQLRLTLAETMVIGSALTLLAGSAVADEADQEALAAAAREGIELAGMNPLDVANLARRILQRVADTATKGGR